MLNNAEIILNSYKFFACTFGPVRNEIRWQQQQQKFNGQTKEYAKYQRSDRYAFNLFDVSKEEEGKHTEKKKVNMTCVFYFFLSLHSSVHEWRRKWREKEKERKKKLNSTFSRLYYEVRSQCAVVLIDTIHIKYTVPKCNDARACKRASNISYGWKYANEFQTLLKHTKQC